MTMTPTACDCRAAAVAAAAAALVERRVRRHCAPRDVPSGSGLAVRYLNAMVFLTSLARTVCNVSTTRNIYRDGGGGAVIISYGPY